MVIAYVSKRLSLRWLPEPEANEATNTIVLTGARTGVFLDVRFFKDTNELDWAFAGYRTVDPDQPNKIHFRHDIDSRTSETTTDSGTNTTLPDGTTLEVGEMMNPATGKITQFEEVWNDEEELDPNTVIFLRNTSGTRWQARAGKWQLGLGLNADRFWAWQGRWTDDEGWAIQHITTGGETNIAWLPGYKRWESWRIGADIEWDDDRWRVLEKGQ